jgi:hypothetical protein
MGLNPVVVALQQDNTQIILSHKITTQIKQISTQSYINSEGHVTANEYNTEKDKMKLSLIQALETY